MTPRNVRLDAGKFGSKAAAKIKASVPTCTCFPNDLLAELMRAAYLEGHASCQQAMKSTHVRRRKPKEAAL